MKIITKCLDIFKNKDYVALKEFVNGLDGTEEIGQRALSDTAYNKRISAKRLYEILRNRIIIDTYCYSYVKNSKPNRPYVNTKKTKPNIKYASEFLYKKWPSVPLEVWTDAIVINSTDDNYFDRKFR